MPTRGMSRSRIIEVTQTIKLSLRDRDSQNFRGLCINPFFYCLCGGGLPGAGT